MPQNMPSWQVKIPNRLFYAIRITGKGNALFTDNGVYVIDLDGVTWDHPGRDLRKNNRQAVGEQRSLSLDQIEKILDWYSEINPLSTADRELIYIDLMYPPLVFWPC